MKKITLLLLFISSFGYSQLIKPNDLKNPIKVNKENFYDKEVWLDMFGTFYIMKFDNNPVGVKHLFDKLKEILSLNNLDINKPDADKSLYAIYAKDLNDYSSINTSILAGDGEIDLAWLVMPSKSLIKASLTKKEYTLVVKQ